MGPKCNILPSVLTPPRVLPALVTPFDGAGDLDISSFRYNLKALVAKGISGFLIGGSTGEGPYLETGERATLVGAARDALEPATYIICGVAGESVRAATAQAAEAAAAGADAVLVLTPTSLIRGNHDAVDRFYHDVADESELPVMLYTVPRVTGYELPAERVVALADHANIIGIKDSGGRPVRMQEMTLAMTQPFFVFAGASAALAASMAAGGYGAITASANYAPELVTAIVDAADRSQPEADALQTELLRLIRVVEKHGLPGTKAAASIMGMRPGTSRRPLGAPHPDGVSEIRAVLETARDLAGR